MRRMQVPKLIVNICKIVFHLQSLIYANEFPKTLDIKIQFPPILQRREGMPTGHLRPLGWQTRSEGSVKEEAFTLRPENFWEKYVSIRKPVMIRSLVAFSESLEKWSDTYLSRYYGHLDVQVSKRKESLRQTKSVMNLEVFLKKYRVEDLFVRSILPQEMQLEVPMPSLVNCGPCINNKMHSLIQLVEPYLWISAGDTSSLIHSQPEQNLHCMIDGRMDFILIPQDQFMIKDWKKKLALQSNLINSDYLFSEIDVDMINVYKYDILQTVKWYWSTVKAGDCIYIPAGYLHQIRSHGRSISTSVYFSNTESGKIEETSSQCSFNQPSFEAMYSFKDNFLWAYNHGNRHLNLGNTVSESDAKKYLTYLIGHETKVLYYERFESFLKEITQEYGQVESPIKIWHEFFLPGTLTERGLTFDEIDQLKLIPNLKRFISVLNKVVNFYHSNSKKTEL